MQLKSKVIKGGASSLAAQAIKFPIRIASISVLARFVEPSEYGKIAIAAAISAVLGIFLDGGLSTAVLQRPKVSHEEQSTMFWLNICLGVVFLLLLAMIGPVVSHIYDDRDMLILLPCYGAVGLFTSIFVQKSVQLQREMRFTTIAAADLAGEVVGVALAIGAAMGGFGFWALFVQFASTLFVRNAIIFFSCKWNPSFIFNYTAVKPMLHYGSSLLLSDLINKFSKGLDALLIGYFFGQGPLGMYNRAQNLLNIPLRQFVGPVSNVARAAIFRKAVDHRALEDSVAAILAIVSLCSAFVVLISLSFVHLGVSIVLGERWMDTIPIFMALTPFAFVEPIASFLSSVLISKGNSKNMLRWRVVSVFIILIGLAIGINWGPIGMALSFALSGLLIRMPLFLAYTCKTTGLDMKVLANHTLPALISGTLSSVIPLLSSFYFDRDNSFLSATSTFFISITLFTIVFLCFPKGRTTGRLIGWIVSKNSEGSLRHVLLGSGR